MKPFDLERAKKGEPVITRDGRNVRIICFDHKSVDKSYTIVATIYNDDCEEFQTYRNDGRFNYDNRDSYRDLFMKPVIKTYHYCIYEYINNKDKSFVISQLWNDLEKLKARYESSKKIKVLEYRTINIEV